MNNLSIDYILNAQDDYEFRADVKELAQLLQAMNDQAAVTSGAIAAKLVQIAYAIDLDADDLKSAFAPTADVLDQIESATDSILSTVADRPSAYLNPPPGLAESATITVSPPREQ